LSSANSTSRTCKKPFEVLVHDALAVLDGLDDALQVQAGQVARIAKVADMCHGFGHLVEQDERRRTQRAWQLLAQEDRGQTNEAGFRQQLAFDRDSRLGGRNEVARVLGRGRLVSLVEGIRKRREQRLRCGGLGALVSRDRDHQGVFVFRLLVVDLDVGGFARLGRALSPLVLRSSISVVRTHSCRD
jgi:hypothetical protein